MEEENSEIVAEQTERAKEVIPEDNDKKELEALLEKRKKEGKLLIVMVIILICLVVASLIINNNYNQLAIKYNELIETCITLKGGYFG